MYLKRLEIKGFKSFFSRTVLDFFPPQDGRNGITAIVGPNGSGKSNISDAIRWVMGEQSYKQLRGKKSEDVIFSGSESKGKLGVAEVIMTLENTGGEIMPDYPEIVITRRLYRSGEGEYLINNQSVRLLDVHLLLAKCQFAQHSYSIVSQGMIDRLLMVSPAERKDFLDEASGIKEYKIKQHQAKLKLARSNENIFQAEALVGEVEPRLRILARQVKKLEKREEVEIKLRDNQEKYYGSIFGRNQIELDNLRSDLAKIESRYNETFKTLKQIQEELAVLARSQSRQHNFDSLQTDHQMLVRQKHEQERQMAIISGQMQAEYGQQGKHDMAWLEKKKDDLRSRYDDLEAKVNKLLSEQEQAKAILAETQREYYNINEKKVSLRARASELEKLIIENKSEQQINMRSGLYALQAVMDNKEKFGKIYGLLSELGEVEEKYRLAMEVAASSYINSLVVENDDVAKKAINFLRSGRFGYATFLPLNKIRATTYHQVDKRAFELQGVYGLAVNLVKHSPRYDDIFSFVYKNTVIVENLDVAKSVGIGTCRMVTLDGDVVDRSGVMRGGFRATSQSWLGFSRKLVAGQSALDNCKIEINEIKSQIQEADTDSQTYGEQMLEYQGAAQSLQARIDVMARERNSLLEEISSIERELALFDADPASRNNMLSKLKNKKDELLKQIKKQDSLINQASEKISAFNEQEDQAKHKVFVFQDNMQKKQEELNAVLMSRNELRVQIARVETKQESLTQEVRSEMSLDVIGIVKRLGVMLSVGEVEQTSSAIQKLKYQLSLIGEIDHEVVEEHDQTKEKYEFLTSQINDLKGAIEDLDKMIAQLDEIMKQKSAAAFKKIRAEFIRYVKILFNGGTADMKEICGYEYGMERDIEEQSDDDIQEEDQGVHAKRKKVVCGIDITVNPPGKKISNISTLSGGERTLSSIALICAVLRHNPAPFVVLDEVEAALDETNSRRFSRILTELSSLSQFIIITHNRVTMHSADALYGVTMGIDGMSKMLSVKLEQAQ
ncbi:MAG: AAA family ATPase [bacterium]